MPKPNWEKIRKEWETTNITLKALAEKHNVKLGTLKSRKSREKWSRYATQKDATRNATQKRKVATKQDDISWIDIENEYVTDIRRKPVTLKNLANKYNIPLQTIKEYSAKNNWTEKRNQYRTKTIQKTTEKSAELISDDLAKVTARHFRVSDKLLTIIEQVLEDDEQFYKYVEKLRTGYGPGQFEETIITETLDSLNESKLLDVVNAVEKLQKMQRQTLNIFDTKEQLAIEKTKAEIANLKGENKNDNEDWIAAIHEVAKKRKGMMKNE